MLATLLPKSRFQRSSPRQPPRDALPSLENSRLTRVGKLVDAGSVPCSSSDATQAMGFARAE